MKLPHDFGTPHVYQTPSEFRYMTWKEENFCGNILKKTQTLTVEY